MPPGTAIFFICATLSFGFPFQAVGGSLLRDYFFNPIVDRILEGQPPDLDSLKAEKMGEVTEYFSPDFDFSVLSATDVLGSGQFVTTYVAVGLREHPKYGKPSRGWVFKDQQQLTALKNEYELWASEHESLSDVTECMMRRKQDKSRIAYFKAFKIPGENLFISLEISDMDDLSTSSAENAALVTFFFANGADVGCETPEAKS